MARFEQVMGRWLSWGGLIVAIACGNAIAALNWFAIAQGYARSDAVAGSASALVSAQRYAFLAVLFLVIGLRLVDRRAASVVEAGAESSQ